VRYRTACKTRYQPVRYDASWEGLAPPGLYQLLMAHHMENPGSGDFRGLLSMHQLSGGIWVTSHELELEMEREGVALGTDGTRLAQSVGGWYYMVYASPQPTTAN
jgi:hypothetical protein